MDDFWCFFTNWATFCNLLLKSSSKHQNMVVYSKKLHSFGQIDDFMCFSTEWGTFCNFLLKSSWKCQDMVVCSKSWKFWPNPWVFVLPHEMRHFLQLLPEKFIEIQRQFYRNADRWYLLLFHEMRHSLLLLPSLLKKLHSFGQMDDFSCFFTISATFCNLLLKS